MRDFKTLLDQEADDDRLTCMTTSFEFCGTILDTQDLSSPPIIGDVYLLHDGKDAGRYVITKRIWQSRDGHVSVTCRVTPTYSE